jgi:hypothetical protein
MDDEIENDDVDNALRCCGGHVNHRPDCELRPVPGIRNW